MAELRILRVVFHTFCVNCGKAPDLRKKEKRWEKRCFLQNLQKKNFDKAVEKH